MAGSSGKSVTDRQNPDASENNGDKNTKNGTNKEWSKLISPALRVKLIGLAVVAVAVFIAFAFVIPSLTGKKENTYFAESNLVEAVNVSKLSTVECTYRGISTKKGFFFGNTEYYVRYEAHVSEDFDLSKIDFDIDRDEKTIAVRLPEPELTVALDESDFDFLPEGAGGNIMDAVHICREDVQKEAEESTKIKAAAYDTIEETVRNLIEPIVGSEYEITFSHMDGSTLPTITGLISGAEEG